MGSSGRVGQIKRLLDEVRGLEDLAGTYREKKRELRRLSGDIRLLHEKRRSIDLTLLKKEIKGLEAEYTEIFRRIDLANMESRVCTTIEDLQRVLHTVKDRKIRVSQCTEFMKTLVTAFCLGQEAAEDAFETGRVAGVRVGRDLEALLDIAAEHSLSGDLDSQFRLLFKNGAAGRVPRDFVPFASNTDLFFVFATSGPATEGPVPAGRPERSSFGQLLKTAPKTTSLVLAVIKDNLSRRVLERGCAGLDLRENNGVFKDTEFWIRNLDDWAFDLLMKRILALSRPRTGSTHTSKDLESVVKTESGVYVSRPYAAIMDCMQTIRSFRTGLRGSREENALSSAVMKFFDSRPRDDVGDLFVAYADTTYQIKSDPGFAFVQTLRGSREALFAEIIERSAAVDLDLGLSPLMLKARLKGAYCDFAECVDLFVSEEARPFFIDQLFSTLCRNLLGFMLRPKKYTKKEKESLVDVVQYFLDLTFECRIDRSECFRKLESMLFVVNSTVEGVVESFRSGNLCLDRSEMRTAVRMFFEPGEERDRFLDSIY